MQTTTDLMSWYLGMSSRRLKLNIQVPKYIACQALYMLLDTYSFAMLERSTNADALA